MLKIAENIVAVIAFVMLFIGISFIAYKIAVHISAAPVKTEEAECKERGGVWVYNYRGDSKCFAKEAFK